MRTFLGHAAPPARFLNIGLLCMLTACGGGGGTGGTPTVTVASVSVTSSQTQLNAGTTSQLKATATYSDGSTADITATGTWSSVNSAVATVSANGLVTGVLAGVVEIDAKAGGATGKLSMTVLLNVTTASLPPATQTAAYPSTQLQAAGGTAPYT